MKVGVLATTLAILLVGGPVLAGPATDTDSDGTFDVLDQCSTTPSSPVPDGCDTDNDGYGNACDGDYNNDGVVNGADFNTAGGPVDSFLECFLGGSDPGGVGCDHNCDGLINGADFSGVDPGFLDFFGVGVPGPSGISCAGTVPCP